MTQSDNTALPRRRFLQQMMVLGGATGVGAMALGNAQAGNAMAPARGQPGQASSQNKGYRLTEHIRTYYEKAQI